MRAGGPKHTKDYMGNNQTDGPTRAERTAVFENAKSQGRPARDAIAITDPCGDFTQGKFTPLVRASLLASIMAGRSLESACIQALINETTVRTWLQRQEHSYMLFAAAMDAAREHDEADYLEQIRRSGAKDWRAPAWLLENSNPYRYGRRARIEHSGPDGGPIEVRTLVEVELRGMLAIFRSNSTEAQFQNVLREIASKNSKRGTEPVDALGDHSSDGEAVET